MYLAWEVVSLRLFGWVVPAQVMVSVGEVDVLLVEDSSPLEWGSMQTLTCRTVAILGCKGPSTTELILDAPTVASSMPLDVEVFGTVNAVRGAMLPLILRAMCCR